MDPEEGLARGAFRADYSPRDPVRTTVPKIVQAALLEAGRVEDPYWERNNEKLLWIESKEWWYFLDFAAPAAREGARYEILFEGLAYLAEIWLDGVNVGVFQGMFARRRIDATELLRPSGRHRLTLRLRALPGSREDRPGGSIPRGTLRSSGVVAPFSYWWNWAPHLVPIGIWKPVSLEVRGPVCMGDCHVRTALEWNGRGEAERATLSIGADLANRGAGGDFTLEAAVTGEGFDSIPLTARRSLRLGAGVSQTPVLEIQLEKPRLWWPNGYGDHPLYRLRLGIADAEGSLCDLVETTFGIRQIEFVPNDEDERVQEVFRQSDRPWSNVGKPYPWTFVVNRKKIFIKGSNWVPVDSLFRFEEARYRDYLDLAENAGLNLLRVWGGGIHETETFYRLCDGKGLLAWTEFWLACANYPAMPQDLFLENAADMIRVLRNHPSLALWCGGNEFNPDARENRGLVDRLAAVVYALDPDRPFHRGSPYKGDRHGGLLMMPTRTTSKYNGDILTGDARLVLFRSEVAVARSAPVAESLRRFIGQDKLWPIDRPTWQYHHGVVKEQERDAREYGAAGSLERWIQAGQLAHAQAHRHNLEYCRQRMFLCSGCLQWQLNASWPALHREIVDFYGIPKPAYYAYKRAAREPLVVADFPKYLYDGNEAVSAAVSVVNGSHRPFGRGCVVAEILDDASRVVHRQEGSVDLGENESRPVFELRWTVPPGSLRHVFFIRVRLFRGGTAEADNLYWIGVSGYAFKERSLELRGSWMVQAGPSVNETAWRRVELPSYWAFPQRAPADGETVFYRHEVLVPAGWKGAFLELFSAGFEGNDRVSWNGIEVGATEEDPAEETAGDEMLFTEQWGQRPVAESGQAPRGVAAPARPSGPARRSVRTSADPFVVPNLLKRFYDIPPALVRWGEVNTIDIELSGDHATGISEPVFLREKSTETEKEAIRSLDDRGDDLGAMADLPLATVKGRLFADGALRPEGREQEARIRLENPGCRLAFFVSVRLDGLVEGERVLYEDNYVPIFPGESRDLRLIFRQLRGMGAARRLIARVRGWNVAETRLDGSVEVPGG
jgi:beta-mannosidase